MATSHHVLDLDALDESDYPQDRQARPLASVLVAINRHLPIATGHCSTPSVRPRKSGCCGKASTDPP